MLYVDDMLIAGSNMAEIKKLKKQLSKEFAMKDLRVAKQILILRICLPAPKSFIANSIDNCFFNFLISAIFDPQLAYHPHTVAK